MIRLYRSFSILAVIVLALLCAEPAGAARLDPKSSHPPAGTAVKPSPEAYGISAYSIASLSDLTFSGLHPTDVYDADAGDYFRYMTTPGGASFVSAATVPAGSVIDFIGLGSCDAAGGGFDVLVYEIFQDGNHLKIAESLSTAHGAAAPCTTDYNASPLAYPSVANEGHTIQVEVYQEPVAPTDGTARFSSVEIWSHLTVSSPPAQSSFGDVPTNHPFFQHIEALAASGITGGCGSGNYCPDNPVTRGQMAVFLAKALGLHWPGNPLTNSRSSTGRRPSGRRPDLIEGG